MKLVLITGEDCEVCTKAETTFRQQYKHEIEKGEAVVSDIDIDEDMQRVWMKQDLPIPPVIAIVSNEGRLITVVDATEFLEDQEKASPDSAKSTAEPVKASVESNAS